MNKKQFLAELNEWFSDLAGASIWDEGTTAEKYENLLQMREFIGRARVDDAREVGDVDQIPEWVNIQKAVSE